MKKKVRKQRYAELEKEIKQDKPKKTTKKKKV